MAAVAVAAVLPFATTSASAADSAAPDVTFALPAVDSVVGNSLTVSIAVGDDSATDRFLASKSGVSYVEDATTPASDFVLDTSGWPEGVAVLSAHAEDSFGNKDAGSAATLRVIVDHTAPVVTLGAPLPLQQVTVGADIVLSGTVVDLHPANTVLSVDGVDIDSRTVTVDPTYGSTVSTVGWAPGEHVLTVTARDSAGNSDAGSVASVAVVLSATAAPVDEQPGAEQPGDGQPGDGQPGDGQPGDEEPGDDEDPDEQGSTGPVSDPPAAERPTLLSPGSGLQPAGVTGRTGAATGAAGATPPQLSTLPAPSAAPSSAADAEANGQLDTFAVPAERESASALSATQPGGMDLFLLLFSGVILALAVAFLIVMFMVARRRSRHS